MKKRLKYLLLVFTVIATMIAPLNGFAIENNSGDNDNRIQLLENALGKEVVDQIQSQAPAIDAYNYLLDNIIDNNSFNLDFIDDYAGAYIDEDKLIISLSNADDQKKQTLLTLFKDYPVVIHDAQYSEKELQEMAEEYIENQKSDINLQYYIDPIDNNIVMSTPENGLMRSVQSSNLLITFKDIPEIRSYAFDLIGGMPIKINKGTTTVTLGVCGTYNGENAIATCGHDWEEDDYVYMDSLKIGQCVKVKYNNLQSGDYSISKIISSKVSTSNFVLSDNDYYKIQGTRTLPVGALAYRYGQKTGLEAVEVTATGVTTNDDGTFIKGLIEATHVSGAYGKEGDSGGPLYAMNSSSKWCISGFLSGGNTSDRAITYYSPIKLLTSAGFTVKTTD